MSLSTLGLAFVSAGILGFRHGFDYDHIAAISDITSIEPSPKTAMRMGFVYILGHAVTLGALGAAVILFPAGAGAFCPYLFATIPNFNILEFSYGEVPWRAELIDPPEEITGGALVLSGRPGLGIKVNEKTAAKYAFLKGYRRVIVSGENYASTYLYSGGSLKRV
jgi:hypothetical protein